MAAYAALLSLMRIIEKLHLHPHPPPISLHQKQVDSLTAKITFLEEFLEAYNPLLGYSTEADPLETRIADAAYAEEDVIESNIVDRITNVWPGIIYSYRVYRGLEKVIQDMTSIQRDAMDITETMGLQLHHYKKSERRWESKESLRSTSIAPNGRSMVGVDDVLLQIKDKLTSHSRRLQIIPIVGMGGSGKTTLASNIYQDRLIHDHFHVYAWATISQEYSIPGICTQILDKLQNREVGQHLSEGDLGDMLHKCLFGRKYLIIMDDMWNIEAWEKVRRFFPDNENGSRIVITTRLSNLVSEITGSNRLEMRLLDEDDSWNLLSKIVFGENNYPLELEEIGKKIAKRCRGLPLSIVVVGGILAKSKLTREFWEHIKENLNSIVNSVDDESCLKILHMSYKQLPLYLKPCFLYMGVFREDEVICVSKLTRLWVAEGFLKPIKGKSLEEIAKEYLKDLTDRNLILIQKKGISGSIKECKIHDLLREFCLREAEIWCMPHIRHVVDCQYHPNNGHIRDPRSGTQNDIVLKNLHTLEGITDFKWSDEAVKRIPNVKKLRITYRTLDGWSCLDNLVSLQKLVSLDCYFWKKMSDSGQSLNFPQSIKKLKLRVVPSDCWQDILEKIGSLPLLEKLVLRNGCFAEGKWETVEGQFQSLRYLELLSCYNLRQWTMESSHFPRLERLHLSFLWELEEIPLQVAEITTLGSIVLEHCRKSAAISARRIVEEQEESNGEAAIQVRVMI